MELKPVPEYGLCAALSLPLFVESVPQFRGHHKDVLGLMGGNGTGDNPERTIVDHVTRS